MLRDGPNPHRSPTNDLYTPLMERKAHCPALEYIIPSAPKVLDARTTNASAWEVGSVMGSLLIPFKIVI